MRPSCQCRTGAIIVLALAMGRPATAQAPDERRSLDAFRDSLAAVGSAAEAATLTTQSDNRAPGLRRALALLRLAELSTDRASYDRAVGAAEAAIDAHRDWPYPWFVLGLAQLGMYRRDYVTKASAYTQVGLSYREAAWRSWFKSFSVDPTFAPSIEAFAGSGVALGHRLLPRVIADGAERARGQGGASSELALLLARVEFQKQRFDRALADVERYETSGGDRGVASLERARLLAAGGRAEEGVRSYLDGLDRLSETGRLAYRQDVAWVAATDELASFDSLATDRVEPWIRRFWEERDALNLRAPGERLAEHLRRWVYTHQHFLLHRPDDVPANAEGYGNQDVAALFEVGATGLVMTELQGGVPRFATYRRTQWEIDDRGVLYLRFGEPTEKVSSVAGPPNESWAYDLPEGRRIFHFLGSRALGTQAGTTLTAALPLNPDMLDARGGLDARYSAAAASLRAAQAAARTQAILIALAGGESPPHTPEEVAAFEQAHPREYEKVSLTRLHADLLWKEVARNRQAVAAAVATDGFAPVFEESLRASAQLYWVGLRAPETRRLLIVFAIPGKNLTPASRPDGGAGVLYPVSFRVVALGRDGKGVTRLDTTRVFAVRDTLRGQQQLVGTLELPITAPGFDARVLVQQPSGRLGSGFGQDSMGLTGPAGTMVLSDLVVGLGESGLTWMYDGRRVALNPLNAFTPSADADLFYEVTGLVPGRRYTASLAITARGAKPDAKPDLELASDFVAEREYQSFSRSLGLSRLKPGSYILTVAIRDQEAGGVVQRHRALNIAVR